MCVKETLGLGLGCLYCRRPAGEQHPEVCPIIYQNPVQNAKGEVQSDSQERQEKNRPPHWRAESSLPGKPHGRTSTPVNISFK